MIWLHSARIQCELICWNDNSRRHSTCWKIWGNCCISWGFKFTAIGKTDTSKFTNAATRTLFSNDSTWTTLYTHGDRHKVLQIDWRIYSCRPNGKNSINRTLAAKCTTCSTPDPISHTQSRKSRNSPQIHRQFTKWRQKDLFDISTGLAILESRKTEARDWSWRDIVMQIMRTDVRKSISGLVITSQSLWWSNHLGI